jgi:peptidyl-prolyl cis-trans isomerase C
LTKPTVLLVAILSTTSLASCGEPRRAGPKPSIAGEVKVLATVNGVPITERDLAQRSKRAVMPGVPDHDLSRNVVQTLVRDELIYQEAVRLGLDRYPEYRQKLADLQAQVRAFQRQEMAARYRTHVEGQAAVTDGEAREYFEANASRIRTRFHVLQILYKGDRSEIAKDEEDLKRGMPFEQVASRRFPGLPRDVKPPWDLGELYWHQLPQPWWDVVDRLEPGRISGVIQGENERFWLLELASKTVDPGITFETEKGRIVEILRHQKARALYDDLLAAMKGRARIVYGKQP